MSNDSGTSSTSADTNDRKQHGGSEGHASDIPEDSPSSESEVSLSEQVADRGSDGEKDE